MNILFRSSLLAACVAVALCEVCTTKDDCFDTTCNTGTKECVSIQNSQLCTCVHSNQHNISCNTKAECEGDNVNMFCNNPQRHCVDNTCRCEGTGHNHGPHFNNQQTGEQQHPDHHQQQPGNQQHPDHHHQQQQHHN